MEQQRNPMGMRVNQPQMQSQTQNHNLDGTQYDQGRPTVKLETNIITQIH